MGKFLVVFDPSLPTRIGSIVIGVAILAGIIVAAITVSVIASRALVKTKVSVVQADMKIGIYRFIRDEELDQFYSPQTTLNDLHNSLNTRFILRFPKSCIDLIVTYFPTKPAIIGNDSDIRSQGLSSIVTLYATVYFTMNYTTNDIRDTLKNYTQNIDLINKRIGTPSSGLGVISLRYSNFTNTYPSKLTEEEAKEKHSYVINTTGTTTTNTPSTVSTTTASSSNTTSSTTANISSTTSTTIAIISTTTSSTTANTHSTTSTTTTTTNSSNITSSTTANISNTTSTTIAIISTTTSSTTANTHSANSTTTANTPSANSITTINPSNTTSRTTANTIDANNIVDIDSFNTISTTIIDPSSTTKTTVTDITDASSTAATDPSSITNIIDTNLLSTTSTTTNIITVSTNTTVTCESFLQVYFIATFEREFASNERLIFESSSSTLQDLTTTFKNRMTSIFWDSFIELEILLFSEKPFLITYIFDNSTSYKTVIITFLGRAYFVQNQSSTAFYAAFANCTQPITLLNFNNDSSSAIAYFSSEYSVFTDTFLSQLTNQQMYALTILCQNNLSTSPTPTITETTSATTSGCQSFTEAYMSVTLVFSISGNETAEFYDISDTVEELNTTLNSAFTSYFSQAFLKFNILMIFNEPIIISDASNRRKKRATDQIGIIIIIGSAYFLEDQTRENISMSLENYQLYISLKDINGQAVEELSVISPEYSVFGDTSSIKLTQEEANELTPLC